MDITVIMATINGLTRSPKSNFRYCVPLTRGSFNRQKICTNLSIYLSHRVRLFISLSLFLCATRPTTVTTTTTTNNFLIERKDILRKAEIDNHSLHNGIHFRPIKKYSIGCFRRLHGAS